LIKADAEEVTRRIREGEVSRGRRMESPKKEEKSTLLGLEAGDGGKRVKQGAQGFLCKFDEEGKRYNSGYEPERKSKKPKSNY
jgi:hypothetical protein